jgi:hypothetical protein
MDASYVFNKISQDLLRHSNATRIKKFILYACRHIWENDPNHVEALDLNPLLQELIQNNPSLYHLQSTFREVIGHINKKAEYSALANFILENVSPLYSGSQTILPVSPPSNSDPAVMAGQPFPATSGVQQATLEKAVLDPFLLRREVVQQSNPLRTKLLLYSALYQPLESNDQGVSLLKRQSLDELLQSLYDACSTPEELESKLQVTARKLDDADLYLQAAAALIQSIKPLFVYTYHPEAVEPQNAYVYDAPQAVEQIFPPIYSNSPSTGVEPDPTAVNSEGFSWLQTSPGSFNRITDLGQQNAVPPPFVPPDLQDFPEENGFEPLQDPFLQESIDPFSNLPVTPFLADPVPAVAPLGQPAPVTPITRKTPGPLPILDEGIRALVDKNANALMITIENTLSDLGNQLDEKLQEYDPNQYLSLKHQVLKGFIQDIEVSSTTFLPILRKLEQAERRFLQPDLQTDTEGEDSPISEEPYSSLPDIFSKSPLIQQTPSLDSDLKRLVRRSMSAVKSVIENRLSELGNDLDNKLLEITLSDSLALKYQALRAFVREIEEISSKFSSLLSRMEEAERKLFGL